MFEFVQNNKVFIQVVLGAVALTFVGFGVGSYEAMDDPYIVKVGDTKIYKRDLDRVLEGQPSDPATRQAALENLIRQELLLADARANGATVTPEQLRKVIGSVPAFQENGQFNQARYSAFLQERHLSAEAFEAQISRDILLQSQLTSLAGSEFVANAVVTRVAALLGEAREVQPLVLKPADFAAEVKTDPAAIKAYYDANAKRFSKPEMVKLDYVVLSQDAVAQGIKISDEEAQQYYEKHKAELSNEQRRASHILLAVSKDAKPDQRAKVKAEADALLKEVRANPAKFAEIAKQKSQDPGSAANGGDLGFFDRGMMVKPFDDVVFRMKPGQISEVVQTEYGYHIIRLDEIKAPDFAAVKAAVVEKLKNQKAGAQFRAQVEKLNEIAYQQGDSLKGIVDALKLEVKRSDWLSRNAPAADPLLNAKVLEAAFSDDVLKKKHNSEPVDAGNGAMVVARIAEHQPSRQQPLTEVSEQIKSELVARDGAKLAEKKGQSLLLELKAGKGLEAQSWGAAKTVSRRNADGLPSGDVRAVFAASANKLPAFAGSKRDNGEYAIYRIEKVIAAPAASDADRAQLGGLLGEMSANSQLASYLEALRQKYKVVSGKQSINDAQ